MRVLVAEASARTRRRLRGAVERLGHDCLSAADGRSAWEQLHRAGADVALIGWALPGLDGLELVRRIRARSGAPYTYAVLLARPGDRPQAAAGLEAGADDYLVEPFDAEEVRLRLSAAARVAALHRQLAARDAERERLLAHRAALLQLARRFAAESDPERLLDGLADGAVASLGADAGLFWRWDEARGELVALRDTRRSPLETRPLRLGQGAAGQAVARGAPVILNDYQRACSPDTPGYDLGIQAAVAVPVLHEGRLLGALSAVTFDPTRRFGAADAELLELVASLGGAALAGLLRSRLEGALLAARTLEHELNNRLALTAGYADLLASDPTLPPHLAPAATEALRGAEEAAEIVRRLRRVVHLHETCWGPLTGSTIDLERSLG